jgi:hypothetical protein
VNHQEEILAALRRVAAAVDGPPDAVRAAARSAFDLRDLDGELAVLIADSRAPDGDETAFEAVRAEAEAGPGGWLLSFLGGGVQVDMEVDEEHGRVRRRTRWRRRPGRPQPAGGPAAAPRERSRRPAVRCGSRP